MQLRLTIDTLAAGGDGVARSDDGRVVFVGGACPGDVVNATIVEEHDRWLKAVVADVLTPSPHRVMPPCPYFGECGGCQWQHVGYEAQLEAKRSIVVEALARIGGLTDVELPPCAPSAEQYGYRNRIELAVDRAASGLTLGFSRRGSADVLPVERCMLLPRRRQGIPRAIAGALRFLEKRDSLGVLRVGVRVSSADEVEVDLWTRGGPFPRAMVARVLADATNARTVTRVIVRGELAARDVSQVEVLAGPGAWEERLGKDRYLVSAPSFFQVNTGGAATVRELVLRAVGDVSDAHVLDLFAGVGTFTLPLAREAALVTAVESSGSAIRDLRRNLEMAGTDAQVEPGDAARTLERVEPYGVAVVDPPRSGLTPEVIERIAAVGPSRLVYVSCDPATLARDAGRLVTEGYRLSACSCVDLFPQTSHVETVATFERP